MPKTTPLINNFTSGELSPLLKGRTDLNQYKNGVQTIENFAVMPYGGVIRSPGTVYVAGAKTDGNAVRLIPFQFSVTQSYMLEFGIDYIRFYKDQGQIVVTSAVGSALFDPTASYTLAAGDFVNVGDYISLNCGGTKRLFVNSIYGEDTSAITIGIETAGDDTLAVTYAAGVVTIKLADTTAAKNKGNLIQIALRASNVAVNDYVVTENAAYAAARPTAGISVAAAAMTSGDTIYHCIADVTGAVENTSKFPPIETAFWLAQTEYEIESPYQAGELYDLQFAQDADTMWIVHPNHQPRKLTRTAHTTWTLSLYAPTANPFNGAGKYPRAVAIWQLRVWFGGTNDDPQKIFSTKSDDYDDMTTGATDDDGLAYTIGSQQVNIIRWLMASKVLEIGTSGGLFSLSSGSTTTPVTPTNAVVIKETNIGCMTIAPKSIGNFTYYAQRNAAKIRQFSYDFDSDAYQAIDMTLVSEHILGVGGIVDMDYQQSPYNMLWCVRTDGQLACMTRLIDQEVTAWTRRTTDVGYESAKWPFVRKWTTNLAYPLGITVDYGTVYVANNLGWNVQKSSDVSGTFERAIGTFGTGQYEFLGVADVYLYDKEVYVSDNSNGNYIIQVFNPTGTGQRTWGTGGSGDDNYLLVGGLCVYNDEVYVCDRGNFRVKVTNTSGVYARKWGSEGTTNGLFKGCAYITVYDDEVYVTDDTLHRVQVFTTAGVYKRQWGESGSGDGQFNTPQGIAVDPDTGFVYVADSANTRVQVFDTSGNFIGKFGSSGTGDGQFTAPTGITIYGGEIFVVDAAVTSRVQVFNYTASKFKSVAVIPVDDGDDEVWVVTQRMVDGTNKTLIEYFKSFGCEDEKDAFFVDCGLTYDGVSTTGLTGLDHLEGRVVKILRDGKTHDDKTVSGGGITLDLPGSKVQVGLGYTSTIKLLPLEVGSAQGTSQGKIQRITKAIIRIYKSIGAKLGIVGTQDSLSFSAESLYTGDKELPFPIGHAQNPEVLISQEDPLPLTILGVTLFMDTKDV